MNIFLLTISFMALLAATVLIKLGEAKSNSILYVSGFWAGICGFLSLFWQVVIFTISAIVKSIGGA